MYVLYGFLAAGCFVSAGMSLTEVYFGAGLDSGWLQNAVFSIALAFSFLARREREKEDGGMSEQEPQLQTRPIFNGIDRGRIRATLTHCDIVAGATVKLETITRDVQEACAWANRNKPRVEAAWAALTGGEAE